MNRSEFTKLAGKCALFVGTTSIISGCKTAPDILKSTTNRQGEIVVTRDQLTEKGTPNLLIQHPNSQFPISLLEVTR